MPPTRFHHINFVVRDLDEATARFENILGVGPFSIVDHAERGARVARIQIGDSWLVLVCPYDADSVPGRHLAEHGEGFFLLSLGIADLDKHLEELADGGIDTIDVTPRNGILDWRVADIGDLHGVLLQLTQETSIDVES